jgi:hypothetical protein
LLVVLNAGRLRGTDGANTAYERVVPMPAAPLQRPALDAR